MLPLISTIVALAVAMSPYAICLYAILRRIERIEKAMLTQTDLDAKLAALPAAIEAAVVPVLAPIKAKLDAIPNVDFTTEGAALDALPTTIAAAVAAAFATPAPSTPAPVTTPTTPPPATTPGGTTPPTGA